MLRDIPFSWGALQLVSDEERRFQMNRRGQIWITTLTCRDPLNLDRDGPLSQVHVTISSSPGLTWRKWESWVSGSGRRTSRRRPLFVYSGRSDPARAGSARNHPWLPAWEHGSDCRMTIICNPKTKQVVVGGCPLPCLSVESHIPSHRSQSAKRDAHCNIIREPVFYREGQALDETGGFVPQTS